MTVSPFDHPLLSGLLGDEEAARHFSVEADIAAMLAFERAMAAFRPDTAKLRAGVARDGVVVPELVRQIRAAVGGQHSEFVHFGATSQDVIDSSLVLRLSGAVDHIGLLLSENIVRLAGLEQDFGGRALMAMTRMQPAIPITVGDRIASWRAPLERHQLRLKEQSARLLVVQFGGAAGTLEKLGDKAPAVRAA
ncbi:MAG: 3-carboxy-cis,cis-muconate cycloisomerase, partial [Mesorhizobium sp.]